MIQRGNSFRNTQKVNEDYKVFIFTKYFPVVKFYNFIEFFREGVFSVIFIHFENETELTEIEQHYLKLMDMCNKKNITLLMGTAINENDIK